jgi:hypothetical protein
MPEQHDCPNKENKQHLLSLRQDSDLKRLAEGFKYFINGLAQPDYDGRGAWFCAKAIWQSPYLELMPQECLK